MSLRLLVLVSVVAAVAAVDWSAADKVLEDAITNGVFPGCTAVGVRAVHGVHFASPFRSRRCEWCDIQLGEGLSHVW